VNQFDKSRTIFENDKFDILFDQKLFKPPWEIVTLQKILKAKEKWPAEIIV
jgi:hypothetical protein